MSNEDAQHHVPVRSARFDSLTSNNTGLWEAFQWFWQKSYAGDYLGLAMLIAGYLLLRMVFEPFHQLFRLDDIRIQFPYAEVQRVPVLWLFLYATGLPLTVIIIWSAVCRFESHKIHVSVLGLAISILLAGFLTDLLKDAVGRPRPDLIARCKPDTAAPKHELVTIEVCTENRHNVLQDGWRSWPSGHSSISFAGLSYLALFFASQTHAIRPKASFALVLLCLAPLLGAAFIAISRLEDYRHDVFDVVCGSLLGFLVAYFHWRRYYPSLLEPDCDEPHPPRDQGKINGFTRIRNEEEGRPGETDHFRIGHA